MLNKKDRAIIQALRNNSREKLSTISRLTGIPISTVHERMQRLLQRNSIRLVTIPDYRGLHYPLQVWIALSTKRREDAKHFLCGHQFTNTVFEVNNGADVMCECLFPGFKEYNDFLEELHVFGKVIAHPVIEELQKEKAVVLEQAESDKERH